MKQRKKINAVELVRGIRDAHARELAGKSPSEVMAFFNRRGDRAMKTLRAPNRDSTAQKYSPGWNERRVREVLDYYESQSEEEAAAEIEADSANTMMEVPSALVPAIRRLIARRKAAGAPKTNNTTLRTPVRTGG